MISFVSTSPLWTQAALSTSLLEGAARPGGIVLAGWMGAWLSCAWLCRCRHSQILYGLAAFVLDENRHVPLRFKIKVAPVSQRCNSWVPITWRISMPYSCFGGQIRPRFLWWLMYAVVAGICLSVRHTSSLRKQERKAAYRENRLDVTF